MEWEDVDVLLERMLRGLLYVAELRTTMAASNGLLVRGLESFSLVFRLLFGIEKVMHQFLDRSMLSYRR